VRRSQPPPARFDAKWIAVLDALNADAPPSNVQMLVDAASRSGDPAFLELVRKNVEPRVTRLGRSLLGALPAYRGPGRIEFALELAQDPELRTYVLWMLAGETDPRARQVVVELARDRDAEDAPRAIEALVHAGAVAEVRGLIRVQVVTPRAPLDYRSALIEAAKVLHLADAAPFLVHEFREGPLSSEASAAMDQIRKYHDRLAAFEDWQREAASGKQELTTLLKDVDPDIRRAAILSLAAMGGTESLPHLVRLAKEEKDPRVRQAALQAVERLATRVDAPTPAPLYLAPKVGGGR
jgi:hypothetical protein